MGRSKSIAEGVSVLQVVGCIHCEIHPSNLGTESAKEELLARYLMNPR